MIASAVALSLGLWSHHFDDQRWNETHDLIGVEYRSAMIASFINSEGSRSNAAGVVMFDTCGRFGCVDAVIGVVDGYRRGTLPLVLPRYRFEIAPHIQIQITATPGVEGNPIAAGFRLEF